MHSTEFMKVNRSKHIMNRVKLRKHKTNYFGTFYLHQMKRSSNKIKKFGSSNPNNDSGERV